ncbi:Rho GTPase activating protein [Elasticomyces elasticus]|nr:Rho GTPase activating protein [Elasticomyces elasticus]
MDSTVSSISSSTSQSYRANGAHIPHTSQENMSVDIPSLIASAGSVEAAIAKLIQEKHSATTHQAQLWRLVEKQRSMILGLNKDLERALKDKERYRKKLKDHLVQSDSTAPLSSGTQRTDALPGREISQSPVLSEPLEESGNGRNSRHTSGVQSNFDTETSRAETPRNATLTPSTDVSDTPPCDTVKSGLLLGAAVESPNSLPDSTSLDKTGEWRPIEHCASDRPPLSALKTNATQPERQLMPQAHSDTPSFLLTESTPVNNPPQSFSSPKERIGQAMRKGPPAPLTLSPRDITVPQVSVFDNSESEYDEHNPDDIVLTLARGRRKTREEDDRQREALASQEEAHRSRSKKDQKSKSKSKAPSEAHSLGGNHSVERGIETAPPPIVHETDSFSTTQDESRTRASPEVIMQHATASNAPSLVTQPGAAVALMSPGLPMSPRPGDRPLNSPMPRPPKRSLASMPASPRRGIAGLPLTPRAPRQPLPLPPNSPLAFASPHLARAEGYHQQSQQSSIGDLLKPSPQPSPEAERPPTSNSETTAPGEVFKGLVSEHHPDLLLPPNALPSIYVKIDSSRLKPSRNSYMAPKPSEENPVLTLAIYARSDEQQLWRLEKTPVALYSLDQQLKVMSSFRERLPDRSLFSGHAPAKMDARRAALGTYFDRLLDTPMDEKAAKVVCKFFSTDAIAADRDDHYTAPSDGAGTMDGAGPKVRFRKEGYLTKRGKNFGGWKARFFVLDGHNFKYYESLGGPHLGSIRLQSAQIGKQSQQPSHLTEEDIDNQYRHAFLILEPKRKDSTSLVRHVLCAESDEERDAWVESLLRYVAYQDSVEESAKTLPVPSSTAATRGPRLQKSMGDLRPVSKGKAATQAEQQMRSVAYNDTVAAEAPLLVGPSNPSQHQRMQK